MNELRDYFVVEFRGDFPQIDNDPRVDLAALTAGDDTPFYVTLPVARVGEASANGLVYDEELVGAIERQMVGKGGILGHIKAEERDTAFPIEDADWVGVKRDGVTLWGKAYIPPGEAREFVRRLKARGGQLATSIYGPYKERETLQNGRWRAVGLTLESLDLAPADRAALKLGGKFAVTAQMETDNDKENNMTKDELLAELTAKDVPASLRTQIIADWQKENDQQAKVAELEQQLKDQKTLNETLQDQVKQNLVKEFEAAVDATVAEYVKLEAKSDNGKKQVDALRRTFRARLVSELGDETDKDKVAEKAKTLWGDEFQLLAETVKNALGGPAAVVSGKVNGSFQKMEDTPENRAAARAKVGL
jgi:hypothetical protein